MHKVLVLLFIISLTSCSDEQLVQELPSHLNLNKSDAVTCKLSPSKIKNPQQHFTTSMARLSLAPEQSFQKEVFKILRKSEEAWTRAPLSYATSLEQKIHFSIIKEKKSNQWVLNYLILENQEKEAPCRRIKKDHYQMTHNFSTGGALHKFVYKNRDPYKLFEESITKMLYTRAAHIASQALQVSDFSFTSSGAVYNDSFTPNVSQKYIMNLFREIPEVKWLEEKSFESKLPLVFKSELLTHSGASLEPHFCFQFDSENQELKFTRIPSLYKTHGKKTSKGLSFSYGFNSPEEVENLHTEWFSSNLDDGIQKAFSDIQSQYWEIYQKDEKIRD